MEKKKLLCCAEGLVIVALGLGALLLSLTIPDNPVSVTGALAWMAQAKALPLLLSGSILLLGLLHTVFLWRGGAAPAAAGGSRLRTILLLLLTTAYLLLIPLLGFWAPTAVYLVLTLFLCGRQEGKSPLFLLALSALYLFLALWVIPTLLRLRLM